MSKWLLMFRINTHYCNTWNHNERLHRIHLLPVYCKYYTNIGKVKIRLKFKLYLMWLVKLLLCYILQGSNGEPHLPRVMNGNSTGGSTYTSSSTGSNVSVPQRIHSITQDYLNYMAYLYQSQEIWDNADTIANEKNCQGELSTIASMVRSDTTHVGPIRRQHIHFGVITYKYELNKSRLTYSL